MEVQMKTTILAVTAVMTLLALPLFGSAQSEGASGAGGVTIDFMALGNETNQLMFKELVEAFNAKQLGVQVNYLPHPEGGWEKVRTMFAGGQATDCIRMDDDDVYDFSRLGMITQLDAYIDADLNRKDYYGATWSALQVDGKVYSANVAFGTNAFIYNKKLFAEAGITAPTTWSDAWEWDEWVEALRKLTKDENNDGRPEIYGAAMVKNHITVLFHSNGTDPIIAKDKVKFNDPKIVQMFAEYADLYKKGYIAPPETDRQVLMHNGKVGMMWGEEYLMNDAPDNIEWDVTPLPKMKIHPYSVDYIRCFVIPTQTKTPDAAWTFYKFWFDEEGQNILLKHNFGVPAMRKVGETTFANVSHPEHRLVFAEALDYEYPLPRNPIGAAWKKIVNSEYPNGLLAGNVSAQDFLDQVQNEITKRIEELKKKGDL
jgi:multiple sugar transport system substrate-binding protein